MEIMILNETYQHVVFTRFNLLHDIMNPTGDRRELRSNVIEKNNPVGNQWLSHRCNLFEKYCLPSFQSQINKNFKWILFCSDETPVQFKERILNYKKDAPFLNILFLKTGEILNLSIIFKCLKFFEVPSHLISTRVDNDDLISTSFIEKIQNCVKNIILEDSFDEFCIDFKLGICYSPRNNSFYLRFSDDDLKQHQLYREGNKEMKVRTSSFVSICENLKKLYSSNYPLNIFQDQHPRLGLYYDKIINLDESDDIGMWMKVDHDKNVVWRFRKDMYLKKLDEKTIKKYFVWND